MLSISFIYFSILPLVAKQLEMLPYQPRSAAKQLLVSKEFSISDCCQGTIIHHYSEDLPNLKM